MSAGLVYRNPFVYEFLIRMLYGRHYHDRYQVIADMIPAQGTVLDVCCGPATIFHRYLKQKQVLYTGIDINPTFIKHLAEAGGNALLCNLTPDTVFPEADIILLQGSLYHFLPQAEQLISALLKASRTRVIIAEPVKNMADSDIPIIRWLSARMTNPGTGKQPHRFNLESFDALMQPYYQNNQVIDSFLIAGGREKIVILSPDRLLQ